MLNSNYLYKLNEPNKLSKLNKLYKLYKLFLCKGIFFSTTLQLINPTTPDSQRLPNHIHSGRTKAFGTTSEDLKIRTTRRAYPRIVADRLVITAKLTDESAVDVLGILLVVEVEIEFDFDEFVCAIEVINDV